MLASLQYLLAFAVCVNGVFTFHSLSLESVRLAKPKLQHRCGGNSLATWQRLSEPAKAPNAWPFTVPELRATLKFALQLACHNLRIASNSELIELQ